MKVRVFTRVQMPERCEQKRFAGLCSIDYLPAVAVIKAQVVARAHHD